MIINKNSRFTIVTGSSGFVGHSIVSLSERKTLSLHRSGAKTSEADFVCDLRNISDVKRVANELSAYSIDSVVHAAATTPWAKNPDYSHDVDIARSVMWLCDSLNIPNLVHISGWNVYGLPEKAPYAESAPVSPTGEYGASKYNVEQYLLSNAKSTHVINLRTASIYGPGQTSPGLITNFVSSALEYGEIVIKSVATEREYIYVEDFVKAVDNLLIRPKELPAGPLNIGSGASLSVPDVANTIKAVLKEDHARDIVVKYAPSFEESEIATNQLVIAMALEHKILDKITPFREGLAKYIRWRINEGI